MKNKNIPAIITLSAGAIACIICIIKGFAIYDTLRTVLIILVIFYIIGLIASKYITKINQAANDAYIQAERERMAAEKKAFMEMNADENTELDNEEHKDTVDASEFDSSTKENK